ncbi:MetQ/NlpA family ABC transporter substrate-binding protein [Alkalicoccobacillus gibsonii]|uniref:MetQ/NlpA family ABC transporter substrate-binding protein n=1 Tax=Alkalicoccobacillus gibsonii TaxID=79881 RepID=UPI0019325E4E|nr:MetQ/NlpA family ABC transporter substrate-binding protein [Alkalicoccobacillus gibsonii]MBM0066213.1 MetQ/NlpA family ABC transporter substrate-binding protein [Alkalicoccobacillus gibsonii]
MKKILGTVGTSSIILALAACGSGDEDTIRITASNIPHTEILEEAATILEDDGIALDIIVAEDYNIPNIALEDGDIDANYFQHQPYLDKQTEEFGYDFAVAGDAIHIEPYALYSSEYDSVDDIPEGGLIIFSNNPAEEGRSLQLLAQEGLITLTEGVGYDATLDDIEENPKNLEFRNDVDASLLPQLYQNNEGDALIINANYALEIDLNPSEDGLITESSGTDNPFGNLIVVRAGDEEREDIQKLVEVLHSQEIQDFIEEKYEGAVLPVQ